MKNSARRNSFSAGAAGRVAWILLDEVSLTSVNIDRITFTLASHVIASRKVKLKGVRFEEMKLNGAPFSLGRIDEKLTLNGGQSVAMPSLPATVFFRDVRSLGPLKEAVKNERVSVTGIARVDLDLNFAEKLFSGHPSGAAEIEIAGDLPVTIPGGVAGRLAALAALTGAEAILGLVGSALDH